jgi:hypothetical protein
VDSSPEYQLTTTLLPFVPPPSRSTDGIDIDGILTQHHLDMLALLSRVGHLHDRRCYPSI